MPVIDTGFCAYSVEFSPFLPDLLAVGTAQYFGIVLRKCRADAEQGVDLRHMAALTDSNTVAIVGSAPQYASGTIDPIEAMYGHRN